MTARTTDADGAVRSVLKFGGSSFSDPTAYRRVARYIARRVQNGEEICVVVSAMSGTTGRLAELLEAIAPHARLDDRDAVLGTGEMLAAALTRAALVAAGVEAVSLNAFQCGWRAAGAFGGAKLAAAPPDSLKAAFAIAPVVVLAGGQAASADRRLMMLGRNSSDLTAVAAASSLECPSVTIFSDVEGVCTADPHRIRGTRILPELGFDVARHYAKAGAKVLYEGCIDAAERHDISIRCASLGDDGETVAVGTTIGRTGHGVQVCLDGRAEIWKPQEAYAPRWRLIATNLAAPEMTPVVNWPGHFAIHPDYPGFAALAQQRNDDGPALVPIVHFDKAGVQTVFAAEPDGAIDIAQNLHDRLLENNAFDRLAKPLPKRRGTNSDVYDFAPRC